MPKPLQETVFNTGPDDSLKAVDVYGDSAIVEAATPTALGGGGSSAAAGEETGGETGADGVPVPPPEASGGGGGGGGAGGGGSASAKAAEERREKYTPSKDDTIPSGKSVSEKLNKLTDNSTTEAIAGTGATPKQVANLFDKALPQNTDALEYIKKLPGETLGRLNTAVSAISGNMDPNKYHNLLAVDLSTYTKGILDLLDKAGLSGLLCGGELLSGGHVTDGLKLGDWLIDIRKFIGCKKGKPEIDLGLVASVNLPTIARSLLTGAAKESAYEMIPELMANIASKNVPLTGAFKNGLIRNLLGEFKSDPTLQKRELPVRAGVFDSALNAIDPRWQNYNRQGSTVSDLTVYKAANTDALGIMQEKPETRSEAVIMAAWPLAVETLKEGARKKYPNLNL